MREIRFIQFQISTLILDKIGIIQLKSLTTSQQVNTIVFSSVILLCANLGKISAYEEKFVFRGQSYNTFYTFGQIYKPLLKRVNMLW